MSNSDRSVLFSSPAGTELVVLQQSERSEAARRSLFMANDTRLTLEECHAKVSECREMARRAYISEHRVMLEHMAQTWERICEDLKKKAH